MMPDIVKEARVQQPNLQSNQPTTDGFKKKVKINEPSLGNPPSYIPVSTPQFGHQNQQIYQPKS